MQSSDRIETDLCVIGAGSGGLSVAAGAAQMGARVVLVEKGRMGGDCLNYGCVPSKALIAAAKYAHAHRSGGPFGVAPHEPEVDFAAVNAHVRATIAAIEPHDSQERFEGLGVTVIRAAGEFLSPTELRAGHRIITAKRFVLATGSSPFIPPIPGLEATPYLTNETLFELTERPEHLIILGGGAIGMEMAQAHRRLGAAVTLVEAATPLAKDDADLAAVVIARLRAEGVEILERTKLVETAPTAAGGVAATLEEAGRARRVITGSHLLIAAGRAPNVAGLGLDKAGARHDRGGVIVDARLRSSNKKIFAIGDVARSDDRDDPSAGLQFTHVAGYHAGIVIRNALFRIPAKASMRHIPWTTYTDPELAQIGLTAAAARERLGDKAQITEWSFQDNDRAQAMRATEGRVKAVLDKSGRIHGASILGENAGELIQIWALALSKGLKIKDVTGMVAPYPTLGEASKRAAGQFYAPKLFNNRTRWIVRQLLRLG